MYIYVYKSIYCLVHEEVMGFVVQQCPTRRLHWAAGQGSRPDGARVRIFSLCDLVRAEQSQSLSDPQPPSRPLTHTRRSGASFVGQQRLKTAEAPANAV